MPLRVIGAGLGRTGTYSLKFALEELGYNKCYHMVEFFQNPDHFEHWDAAFHGRPTDWDALFEGYQAIVDYPGCMFYRQYMEKYPDAKVILTMRSPESWYESASSTIFSATQRAMSGAEPPPPEMMRIFGLIGEGIFGGHFGGRIDDRDHAIGVFNRHAEEVKRTVPADRLLVFEAKEGWAPLCEFLEVPVPEGKPYPRLNTREDFLGHNLEEDLRRQREEAKASTTDTKAAGA